jgi:hypothetical protein
MFEPNKFKPTGFKPNRFKPSGLTLAFILLYAAPLFWAQSPDLPAGPMQAKAQTACLECHESRIILQQRLSKKVWTKEVDKMIKWGAVVDPNDRDAFIDYLSVNFAPDKPEEPESRVGAGKKH